MFPKLPTDPYISRNPIVDQSIDVGTRVKFDPFCCTKGFRVTHKAVTGKVVYVNEAHRWFCITYSNGLRIGFRFEDIGDYVVPLTMSDKRAAKVK